MDEKTKVFGIETTGGTLISKSNVDQGYDGPKSAIVMFGIGTSFV